MLREHFSFIIPIFITYAFGFCFVCVAYYLEENAVFYNLVLDALLPTTITYALTEIINNLSALKSKSYENNSDIWTILAAIMVALYEIIYMLYYISKRNTLWSVIALLFAFVIWFLVYKSYMEKYVTFNRNHGLV